jgi:hypothetical protein
MSFENKLATLLKIGPKIVMQHRANGHILQQF